MELSECKSCDHNTTECHNGTQKRKYCFVALSIQWSVLPSYPADVRVSAWWQRWRRHPQVVKACHSSVYGFCVAPSTLRFLIPNLHPICTCSCLFTPLTEGRSARDLTQAAPSQKKKNCVAPSRDCRSLLSSSATIGTQSPIWHTWPLHTCPLP